MPLPSVAVGGGNGGHADQYALLVFYFRINACGGGLSRPAPRLSDPSARHRRVGVKVEMNRTVPTVGRTSQFKRHISDREVGSYPWQTNE